MSDNGNLRVNGKRYTAKDTFVLLVSTRSHPKVVTTWVNRQKTFNQIALELVRVYLLDKRQHVPFAARQKQGRHKKQNLFSAVERQPRSQTKRCVRKLVSAGQLQIPKFRDCRLETSEPLERTSNTFEVAQSRA